VCTRHDGLQIDHQFQPLSSSLECLDIAGGFAKEIIGTGTLELPQEIYTPRQLLVKANPRWRQMVPWPEGSGQRAALNYKLEAGKKKEAIVGFVQLCSSRAY